MTGSNIRRYVLYLYIETLKQRLDAINQLRVDRALAAMGPAFQQVYSLLPTLLHYHHPLMPGYLDGNVPSGICFYTPDETQRHYLNELELYRGMTPQDPPKGELRLPAFTPWAAPPRSGRAARPTWISGCAISPGSTVKSVSCCNVSVACWKAGRLAWR
ncbi:Adenylate cyclase [Salmonella enterica subsp. enterica]|uniref:Adenylate cyclase n=1 Tax=Salmonella enterica I TaxID=59201 RepID=A0A379WJ03_SALET|nr:Adenylate cyclase [Salmonella enterica subsp. enterica]